MIIPRKTTVQLIKFAMVGVLNTVLSLVVIYALMSFFHVGVYMPIFADMQSVLSTVLSGTSFGYLRKMKVLYFGR